MTENIVTTAVVKSPVKSKTNITAVILAVFGVLTALGVLPPEVSNAEFVGSVTAAASVLIVAFRTLSNAVLSKN